MAKIDPSKVDTAPNGAIAAAWPALQPRRPKAARASSPGRIGMIRYNLRCERAMRSKAGSDSQAYESQEKTQAGELPCLRFPSRESIMPRRS